MTEFTYRGPSQSFDLSDWTGAAEYTSLDTCFSSSDGVVGVVAIVVFAMFSHWIRTISLGRQK